MARYGDPSPRNNNAEAQRSFKFRIMGFMKRLRRSKSPRVSLPRDDHDYTYHGPDCTDRLSDDILRRIFELVCPHTSDESLESSEESGNDGCMSCDVRDLAHCALTKRQWYGVAAGLLYKSIRIDAVHYCELEEVYAEERRHKTRHGDAVDPPAMRLQQLCRTLRDNHYVGSRVRFLKLPYMTREACKADLARTVSVCPSLEYVDLPDGFYTGDPTCHTLRQELQARCPHIRRMRYEEGTEQAFETLQHGFWQELRVVEINKMQIEPAILRRVLSSLPWLSELRLTGLDWMNDSFYHSVPGLPELPALDTLSLSKIHGVTAQGLASYLANPVSRSALQTLQIKSCTNIPTASLHIILQAATSLTKLEYAATVSASLPIDPIPPLASASLRTLHYEVISTASSNMYCPSASYYQYLTSSLMSNVLPALRHLYVRDPDFPESLTLAPPIRPFADPNDGANPPPRGFTQPLEVFSKGLDELEWIFTSIIPPDGHGRRGSLSGGRPLSSYSASKGLGPQWGGDARKSVVVPNGFGGFLAVPADAGMGIQRPRSAGHLSPGGGDAGQGTGYHAYSQSVGSQHEGTGSFRGSFLGHGLAHAHQKRASRADLWR